MDWGLVALDPKRFPNMSRVTNVSYHLLYTRQQSLLTDVVPQDWPTPHQSLAMLAREKTPRMTAGIELQLRTADGEVPFVVHKLGRTSSATEGRLNEIALQTITYRSATTSGNSNVETKALVVLDSQCSDAFARPGDSGSLVVDKNGAAVGLVIACQSRLAPYYAAFVTPIEEIMSDMKAAIERADREQSGSSRPVKIEFL